MTRLPLLLLIALFLLVAAITAQEAVAWKCQACDVPIGADRNCPSCGHLGWGCLDCGLAYKYAGTCVCTATLQPLDTGPSEPVSPGN